MKIAILGTGNVAQAYFLMFVALMQSLGGPAFNIRLITEAS
jgi:hypothetical protein